MLQILSIWRQGLKLLQTAINFLLHTAIPPEDANKYIEGISAPVQAADPRIGVAYNKAVEQFLHTFNLARLPKPDR